MNMKNKFTTAEGEFISTYDNNQLGYLEELMEWIYLNPERTINEKLIDILELERIFQIGLGELSYKPTWSIKLKEELHAK